MSPYCQTDRQVDRVSARRSQIIQRFRAQKLCWSKLATVHKRPISPRLSICLTSRTAIGGRNSPEKRSLVTKQLPWTSDTADIIGVQYGRLRNNYDQITTLRRWAWHDKASVTWVALPIRQIAFYRLTVIVDAISLPSSLNCGQSHASA